MQFWFKNATTASGNFITQENGNDLFVHTSEIQGYIDEGDKVEFEIGDGQKGPCAINVKKLA